MRMMAGNEGSSWVRNTEDRSEEGPQVRSQDRPEDDLARIIVLIAISILRFCLRFRIQFQIRI